MYHIILMLNYFLTVVGNDMRTYKGKEKRITFLRNDIQNKDDNIHK